MRRRRTRVRRPNAAQYDLGILYDKGLGLARDPIEAVIWYQSAADQNQPIAQSRLGMVYLAGGPVPRNPGEAVRWLRRAAEQGVPDAQAALASLYERGEGIARSNKSAYGWYSLAGNAGIAEAHEAQSRLAESLSSPELDEAEAWTAKLAVQIAALASACSPPPAMARARWTGLSASKRPRRSAAMSRMSECRSMALPAVPCSTGCAPRPPDRRPRRNHDGGIGYSPPRSEP